MVIILAVTQGHSECKSFFRFLDTIFVVQTRNSCKFTHYSRHPISYKALCHIWNNVFSHLWWNIISSLLFTSWTNILIWKNHTYSIKNKSQKTFLITNCSYGFCVLQIKFENQSYLDLLLEASASKGIFLVSLLTLMVFTNMHATHLTKNANSLHFNIVYFFYPNWQICD